MVEDVTLVRMVVNLGFLIVCLNCNTLIFFVDSLFLLKYGREIIYQFVDCGSKTRPFIMDWSDRTTFFAYSNIFVDDNYRRKFSEACSLFIRDPNYCIAVKENGDDIVFTDVTNDVDQYETMLEPGDYKMLIFNHSFNEFGSIRFAQTKSFNNIYAFAQQLQRTTDFWDINTSYRREPEHIGCAIDSF